MRQIIVLFRKELKDTLRDRRTLLVMAIIPLLIFPLIMGLITKIQSSSASKESLRVLKVGYHAGGNDYGLGVLLSATPNFNLVPVGDTATLKQLIRDDSLDVGAAIFPDFGENISSMGAGQIFAFAPGSKDIPRTRLKMTLEIFQKQLEGVRLDSLGLRDENIHPVKIITRDTATRQENFGKIAGGFLPYIFILFCYMGCVFPAIDLFTGEKERGTIETLLSAPIERWKILTGKMMVIVVAGFSTAILALLGMFLGLQFIDEIPEEILELVMGILNPQFILTLLLMLLPLVTFFAGFMIPATVYAKSFKEASSILTPLNFMVIIPAVIGMLPGIELNAGTALIPVLNVVLTTKELIAGTLNWGYFALVLGSLFVLAFAAVAVSFRRFGDERNILRV